jgi:predicted nuclease of predicted toxin-antitoxin system
VRLSFANNLSPRLVEFLDDLYRGSVHVRSLSFERASDQEIWDYAKASGYMTGILRLLKTSYHDTADRWP